MRIVYLHQYFVTPDQAGGTRSYEFARRLAARGHEVHLVTSNRDSNATERKWVATEIEGFTVHTRAVPYDNSMNFAQRIKSFIRFALASAGKARSLRGDVIFASSTPLTIFLPAWYAAALRRTPIVLEIRDSWPTVPIALGYLNNPIAQRLARLLEKHAYKRSAKVVALSPGMKEDAVAHGAASRDVVVIPNSCDNDLFDVGAERGHRWRAANDIAVDAPLIVYTGTFGAVNDVGFLVDVAAEAAKIDSRVVFALIGSGAMYEKVRQRARDLGVLGTNVRVLPPVPKYDMSAVLSAADIATSVVAHNPALNANSANKFFDALAAGRPIAINYGGWQADLIREHKVGLVLDRHNVRGSAAALLETTAATRAGGDAGKNARKLALSMFNRDTLALQLAKVLESVA